MQYIRVLELFDTYCMYIFDSVVVLLCLCAGEQYSAASVEAVSDDALFRDKLKHMGKCKSDLQYY